MQKRVLVVEDEPKIREGIVDVLSFKGFDVIWAERGDEALSKALRLNPDLILLDVMLPKLSGLDVCQNLRESGIKTPILMLSAKGGEDDRIRGLEQGADDYIVKPFSVKELLARIDAHFRRQQFDEVDSIRHRTSQGPIRIKNVTLDFSARSCKVDGTDVHLSEKEFLILQILIKNMGQVVERETLLKEVWGYSSINFETRTIDVTIGKLRQKIEADASKPEIIKTKRGKGFIVEDSVH